MPAYTFNKIKGDITPIGDHILVINMERGDRITPGGIIVMDDNGKDRGIRPRWCQVWKTGPKQTDVVAGDWILVEHGRWTWGMEFTDILDDDGNPLYVQRVDTTGILLVSDACPV